MDVARAAIQGVQAVALDKPPANAPVYRIPVSTSGGTLQQGQDNGFVATDGAGEVVFRIAPAVMWDRHARQIGLLANCPFGRSPTGPTNDPDNPEQP